MTKILDNKTNGVNLDLVSEPFNEPSHEPSHGEILHVPTTRFGTLEVETDLVLTLPEGLIGFEACTRYTVVRHDEKSPFRWLQSLDIPQVAFPIVPPGEFRPDYNPSITDADARTLQISQETPVLVFAIVTVPPHDPRSMTANLLAPLVINGLTRQGKQVIVLDEGYTTRHSIVEEIARATALLQAAKTTAPPAESQGATSALRPKRNEKMLKSA